jgi:hypothetical protein
MSSQPGWPGQDSQGRTAGTGQPGQERPKMTSETKQQGQDCQDRPVRSGQQKQGPTAGHLEQESKNMKLRKGQHGQRSQDLTARS